MTDKDYTEEAKEYLNNDCNIWEEEPDCYDAGNNLQNTGLSKLPSDFTQKKVKEAVEEKNLNYQTTEKL